MYFHIYCNSKKLSIQLYIFRIILIKGMEHVTPNILTGLLIKENKYFSFKQIDLNEITTQTKSTELYIYDKFNGIIWEG